MNHLMTRNSHSPLAWIPEFEQHLNRLMNEGEGERFWRPSVDIRETEDAYTIEADMPGVSKDAVDVSVEDNVLTITAERKDEHEESQEGYRRRERRFGTYKRTFTLPREVDAERVDAHYANGVLSVTLPKREEAKPRQIDVKFN
jgi:HSP20 family protein